MAQDPGNKPKKHGFSNNKLRLSAPNPNVKGGRWAQLGFDVWNNNPRLILHTNDPNLNGQENSFGRFQVPVDHVVLSAIVETIKYFINSKEPGKVKIENKVEPPRNSGSKELIHKSDIWVGRDEQGVIYISVIAKDDSKWPTIKFAFNNSDGRFHKFYHSDSRPYSKAEESVVYARAWTSLLTSAIGADIAVNYAPPITPFSGGGNKGGGNWNKGGNNNYQKPNNNSSSDTPDIGDDSFDETW